MFDTSIEGLEEESDGWALSTDGFEIFKEFGEGTDEEFSSFNSMFGTFVGFEEGFEFFG